MDVALGCPHCGTPANGTRFCITCGSPVTGATSAHQAVVPTEQATTADAGASLPTQNGPTTTAVIPAMAATPAMAAPWLDSQPRSEPQERGPRRGGNFLGAFVLAALVLSAWAIVRGVEEHTVSGTVLLVDSTYFGIDPGDSCTGEGGYRDIGAGAQVVVTDEKGSTLSTSRLSAGEFDGLGCVFSFALEDVSRADFYGVTVAGGSRGELQYSYRELSDADWSLQLTLGDD